MSNLQQSNGVVIGASNPGHGAVVGKTAYEGVVIARALERAGANPHLKGHIQEIFVQDACNLRHLRTLSGARTELTRSTTAGTVDLITTKSGRVIERIQVKDVTSQAGIDKLVKQCADGKYRSAKLVGSPETAEAFNRAAEKAGVSKRMTSSGVSSKTTEAMAHRAGAAGSGTLMGAVATAAKAGGVGGAVIGGGVAAVSGCIDLVNGDADVADVAVNVLKASAKGGTSGAAAAAAATVSGAGTAAALAAVGISGGVAAAATVAVPLAVAAGVGYAVSELWDALFD